MIIDQYMPDLADERTSSTLHALHAHTKKY